jgi:hypothetical protein
MIPLMLSNDYLNFFGEYEAIIDTALVPESGPKGGLFDEKKTKMKNFQIPNRKESALID